MLAEKMQLLVAACSPLVLSLGRWYTWPRLPSALHPPSWKVLCLYQPCTPISPQVSDIADCVRQRADALML